MKNEVFQKMAIEKAKQNILLLKCKECGHVQTKDCNYYKTDVLPSCQGCEQTVEWEYSKEAMDIIHSLNK